MTTQSGPGLTSLVLVRIADRIQDRLESQTYFDTSAFLVTDVDTEAMPVSVKQAVWVQEASDAGPRFARKELEERRQVLGANVFGRQYSMTELMGVCEVGEAPFGLEGQDWRRRALFVEVAERCAEQTSKRVS